MSNDRREFLKTGAVLAAGAGLTASAESAQTPNDTSRLGRTAHTRFAVNLEMWWRNVQPFTRRIELAAGLGFQAIEFWPYEGKDIGAIADTCQRLKIEIAQFTAWGFTPGLNDPRNHNRFVEKVEEACKIAQRLQCRMMCVVAGNDIAGMTQTQMHENVIAGLRRAIGILDKHNMTLILEPMNIRVDHKGHCLYGSDPTVRIIRAVNSTRVKMLADLYHLQITEGDLCGHLRDNFPHVAYYQIADHPGRNEPGTGEINYTRVLKQLHDLGYRGHVGLELRPRGTEVDAARAVSRADQW
ncbi:MAG: TIM barrel protein [Planctomycetes bacterium]|nr:TIM barrel protein [Planctomycetota bacterium]